MSRPLALFAATFVSLSATGSANADTASPTEVRAAVERPRRLRIPIAPTKAPDATATPRIGPGLIIFMNRNGGTYQGGYYEDSRTNTSTLISGTRSIPAFPYDEATWQGVMQCMREIYGPFDVEVTDVDPGSTPHIENVMTTVPSVAQQPQYTGGVSPWTCGLIENANVWTFASVWGPNVRDICETAAQETAHSFALDHEYLCADPMTYLYGCGNKSFQNVAAPCGEDGPRTCECTGSSTQNSVQMLNGIFGSRDNEPPTTRITQPANNATVSPGFIIDVNVSDDGGVDRVEFYLNGTRFTTDTSFPFSVNALDNLVNGNYTLEVRAFDDLGLSSTDTITVHVSPPCASSDECGQSYEVCIDGACVAGPDVDNGLGDSCEANTDCYSGSCLDDGREKHCVEACTPDDNQCPSGYDCLATSAGGGVCWPGGGGGTSGGCGVSSSRGASAGAFLLALGLLGYLISSRRRR
jgi:MYXO-CTERM domain-containing protein